MSALGSGNFSLKIFHGGTLEGKVMIRIIRGGSLDIFYGCNVDSFVLDSLQTSLGGWGVINSQNVTTTIHQQQGSHFLTLSGPR